MIAVHILLIFMCILLFVGVRYVSNAFSNAVVLQMPKPNVFLSSTRSAWFYLGLSPPQWQTSPTAQSWSGRSLQQWPRPSIVSCTWSASSHPLSSSVWSHTFCGWSFTSWWIFLLNPHFAVHMRSSAKARRKVRHHRQSSKGQVNQRAPCLRGTWKKHQSRSICCEIRTDYDLKNLCNSIE